MLYVTDFAPRKLDVKAEDTAIAGLKKVGFALLFNWLMVSARPSRNLWLMLFNFNLASVAY